MLKQLFVAGALVLSSQAMVELTQLPLENIAITGSPVKLVGLPAITSTMQLPAQASVEFGTMATMGLGLLSVVTLRVRRKCHASWSEKTA